MKKFILLPVLAILLVSCTTTEIKVDFSEKEASYALIQALETASSKAFTKTDAYLSSTEQFIPSNYAVLDKKRNDIAGLNTMLENWQEYTSSYVVDSRSSFEEYITTLIGSFVFEDSVSTVLKGNSSATTAFFEKNGNAVLQQINQEMSNLDTELFEKAIKQYNLWAKANNFLGGETIRELVIPDIKAEISKIVYQRFKNSMVLAEELFRTTPSADSDPTVAKVFGLE